MHIPNTQLVYPLTKNGLLEVEDLPVWAEAGPGGGCGGLEPQGRRQPSPHQQEQRAASRQLSAHQQDLRLHHQNISIQQILGDGCGIVNKKPSVSHYAIHPREMVWRGP